MADKGMPSATDNPQTSNQKPSCADKACNIALHFVKELEDLPGFPPLLRQMQTEYIGWMVRFFRVYRRIPALSREYLPAKFLQKWQDTGSGSGGPIAALAGSPEWQSIAITLSDLYPQEACKLPPNCRYEPKPTDALHLKLETPHTISFFNAFHHFTLQEQSNIISSQLKAGHAVFVAEILQPNLLSFLRILLATTIGQVLFCPLVTPFRWKRILFTWLLPVNLLTVTWDGLVSVLKSPRRRDYALWKQQAEQTGSRCIVLDAGNLFLPVKLFIAWPVSET